MGKFEDIHSLPLTAAFDRGPAKYFHGRKKILENFDELVERAAQSNTGTTLLIQGAPGAGKTALLYELASHAQNTKWDVVKIDLRSLYDPVAMAQDMGKPYIARKQSSISGDAKILSTERTKEISGLVSVKHVLREMASEKGLILVLDEAQQINTFVGSPNEADVTDSLTKIHNGDLEKPIILLVGGLGTTSKSFELLGISRFARNCFVNLGALSEESERAVIFDWLTKEGNAKGDPTIWIDAIVGETHGWPQHILSYAKPAVNQLKVDGGAMTPEGLTAVLKAGIDGKIEYYERRVDDFSRKQCRSLVNLITNANVSADHGLDEEDIMDSLKQECGEAKARELFHNALHRGLLHKHKGMYTIPIPSMHTWLQEEYGRE
ncbi:MAG: AAA family ATPase [Bacteroidetes bacterium]|nr:AAA family ATPase [Bacteroidota bacterium]MCY4204788.1 AAA family ATPase [Bacteroidota bacterium]